MNIIKESPILHAETRTGKNKYWQGFVVENLGDYFTQTCYWQDTADGESTKQYSEAKYVKPTNIGRANEKNSKEQALFNLESMIAKQNDKGYSGEGVEKKVLPTPMLANKWHDKKHTVDFPVCLQPKLDGVRMLFKDGIGWSRMGKPIIPEVVTHIGNDSDGLILDGELIYEGASFQDTVRAIKKFRPEMSPKLTYHVFDVIKPDMPFVARYELLEDFFRDNTLPEGMKLVPTIWGINDEADIMEVHGYYTQQGYEGTIIRTLMGHYQIGQRSSDLLKLKDFDDAEFGIIGVDEGEGKDAGAAIFICALDNGGFFSVRPKGTIGYRREIWDGAASYIGRMLTVRYQGFSEDGVPRFPIGIAVRDEIQG